MFVVIVIGAAALFLVGLIWGLVAILTGNETSPRPHDPSLSAFQQPLSRAPEE